MSAYTVRRADVGDAAIIATHRALMFRDMGQLPDTDVPLSETAMTPWLAERMASGEYIGWFVEHDGRVVAGGGVLLRDQWSMPPHLLAPGRNAHVGNVYTESAHRRRGVARLIMRTILDWCTANAIDLVTLSASPDGRSLYEQLGFTPDTRAMRLFGAPSRRE
jgi:GNAT superfamily N-acetyltransferase